MSFFRRLISDKPSQTTQGSLRDGGSRVSAHTSDPSSTVSGSHCYNGQADPDQSPTHGEGPVGGGPAARGARTRTKHLLLPHDNCKALRAPVSTSSRLSKTFTEIMHDAGATQCLLHYLQSRRCGHLLQFWLDAQSFQAATWSRLQTQNHKVHQQLAPSDLEAAVCGVSRAGNGDNRESPVSPGSFNGEGYSEDTGLETSRLLEAGLPAVSEHPENVSGMSPKCKRRQSATDSQGHGAPHNEESLMIRESPCPNSPSVCDTRQHPDNSQASKVSNSPPADPSNNNCMFTSDSSMASDNNHGDLSSNLPHPSGKQSTVHHTHSTNSAQTDPQSPESPQGCPSSPELTNSEVTPASKIALLAKLRKSIERDAVKIYSQYISKDAPRPIGISDKLRNTCISKICREDGQVDPQCFVPCQEYVLEVISKEHYDDFMQSEYQCKHQVDVLTGSTVTLSDILYNESAIVYFMEYMEQEKAMSLLQCWLELDSFRKHLASQQGQYDPQQAQNDAMVIYEKYFSLQAKQPLGFSDDIRFQVEGNICREEGPLPDCFEIPKQIILATLDKVHLQYYLQSELYFKYLSDLISTVQTAQDLPPLHRKRTESDASSEKSFGSHSTGSENIGISSKNTLLAADTSGHRIKKAIHKINDDMRIDDTLFNPDSLWQRGRAGQMSFGKVDNFGRFISEFDPQPDQDRKKKGSFFKKKKEKEKDQEQMALQIAQMIISDITSTTSVEPNLSSEHSTTQAT